METAASKRSVESVCASQRLRNTATVSTSIRCREIGGSSEFVAGALSVFRVVTERVGKY